MHTEPFLNPHTGFSEFFYKMKKREKMKEKRREKMKGKMKDKMKRDRGEKNFLKMFENPHLAR